MAAAVREQRDGVDAAEASAAQPPPDAAARGRSRRRCEHDRRRARWLARVVANAQLEDSGREELLRGGGGSSGGVVAPLGQRLVERAHDAR